MIVGTGIDLVEVSRIAQAVEREHFCSRVFTAEEQAYANGKPMPQETYAGMFAAKEALVKAFGTGLGAADLIEMEVRHDERGCPMFCLTGRALEQLRKLGAKKTHLSISHTKDLAIAQVILEG